MIQKIREHISENGIVELEYYIHYDDCNDVAEGNMVIDDKRMEGWVPAKKISLFNKKSSKRPREPDGGFIDKVIRLLRMLVCRNRKANPLSLRGIMLN